MNMVVKILPNEKEYPPGKLADAELHFTEGQLEGMKLVGFAVWERSNGSDLNVTFPVRRYSVNGERRNILLLRPIEDVSANAAVRYLILDAFAEYEKQFIP